MRAALLTLSTLLVLSTLQAGCSKKQTNQNGASASSSDNAAQGPTGGDARAFFERGMDAHKNDRDEEAVEDFKQAVQLDPDFAEAHYRLGVVLHITGQTDEAQKSFEEAVKAYEKLTKQDPKNSDAYYFMALCYERLDKYEDAVRALREAVRNSPDDDKYYELALAHFKLAQYDESVAALNKALEINPDNYPAQDLLEKAKAGAERVAEIRRHQEQLLKQKNANAGANSNANAGANANTNAAANGNKNDAPSP